MDTQKYILAQVQSCYSQAIKFGGVDTNFVIGQLFDEIMDSPAASSNPSAYIQAHPMEYRELTYYGDSTLQYIYSEFLKAGQTGLKGHIMRIVMDELIGGEALTLSADNGQEYFDAWIAAAQRRFTENSSEYMKEHSPKAWLLLQMITETH